MGIAGLCLRPRFWRPMLAYMLLRSALLTTVEAPEARYTIECFPMLFALGGLRFGGLCGGLRRWGSGLPGCGVRFVVSHPCDKKVARMGHPARVRLQAWVRAFPGLKSETWGTRRVWIKCTIALLLTIIAFRTPDAARTESRVACRFQSGLC